MTLVSYGAPGLYSYTPVQSYEAYLKLVHYDSYIYSYVKFIHSYMTEVLRLYRQCSRTHIAS